ncbi:hypothetical protein BD324DRAFT_615583 [Kockovaella imperatae]|uniref:Uncharacterized protein n=1 Tax=Kockovaella imperatae TaxID=4999 RepID=A0A1Y1UR25_9TREE|nr:hypothetical protein BD324DRAFT_615583 [Kockovaella imperatae]ORX39934.1 hypothetical protein BD324DRAFT_615583 [Kockovaella imperatae]
MNDWPEDAHLPIDILPIVARHLASDRSLHSLATLLQLSTEHHRQLQSLLYSDLVFSSDASFASFLRATENRIELLSLVEIVKIDEVPSHDTTEQVLRLVERVPGHRIFPRVHTVIVSEYALRQLAESAPSVVYNASRALFKRQEAFFRLAQPRILREVCPGDLRTSIPISELVGLAARLQESWAKLECIERRGAESDSILSLTFVPGAHVVLGFHLVRLPQCRFPVGWSDTLVAAYLSLLCRRGQPERMADETVEDASWPESRRQAFLRYIQFGLATALERGSSSTVQRNAPWKLAVSVGPMRS